MGPGGGAREGACAIAHPVEKTTANASADKLLDFILSLPVWIDLPNQNASIDPVGYQ
jgi:hypothetical protein